MPASSKVAAVYMSYAVSIAHFSPRSFISLRKYPAILRLREKAWEEFTPFLRFDTEIRRIVRTTNAIESVNARIRRAVNARGHFPNEQAVLKCVHMAIVSLDPTGKGHACGTMPWKTALNTFDGRLSAARQ